MQTLTIEEAAAVLKVNPETVRRQLRSGKMPGLKIGNQWRLIPEELAAMRPKEVRANAKPTNNRQNAIKAARGIMKDTTGASSQGGVVARFLEEKRAETDRDTAKEIAGVAP